jgi:cob(I)alamin adenosyltransferase
VPEEIEAMFGWGNSKEKLQKKYNQLMQESFELSTVNRKQSDLKQAEAEKIAKQLDELEKKEAEKK